MDSIMSISHETCMRCLPTTDCSKCDTYALTLEMDVVDDAVNSIDAGNLLEIDHLVSTRNRIVENMVRFNGLEPAIDFMVRDLEYTEEELCDDRDIIALLYNAIQ